MCSDSSSSPPTAAERHDWQRQPPRLRARDVAHTASVTPSADRFRENTPFQSIAIDERGLDDRWGIAITVGGVQFVVELLWQARQQYRRWLVTCQGCERAKTTLYLVAGRLQCRECGGVRVLSSACPSILQPLKRLTRAEQQIKAERKRHRDRRKFARIAGAQVFPGGSVKVKVAQTLVHSHQDQSIQRDVGDD